MVELKEQGQSIIKLETASLQALASLLLEADLTTVTLWWVLLLLSGPHLLFAAQKKMPLLAHKSDCHYFVVIAPFTLLFTWNRSQRPSPPPPDCDTFRSDTALWLSLLQCCSHCPLAYSPALLLREAFADHRPAHTAYPGVPPPLSLLHFPSVHTVFYIYCYLFSMSRLWIPPVESRFYEGKKLYFAHECISRT